MRRQDAGGMVLLVALGAAASLRAELPTTGWPQVRHDAKLTGRGTEPALTDPQVAWIAGMGAEGLEGEMVANGCALYVPVGSDGVERVNARSGERPWMEDQALPECGSFRQHAPTLALAADGLLLAGFPADGAVAAVQADLCLIAAGCFSYSIDNNRFPPGLDLPTELAPYIPWPENRCTGAPAIVSDVPSLGDVRYRSDDGGTFWLGTWWQDDGLFPSETWCLSPPSRNLGLHPSWPVSLLPTSAALALDVSDGSEQWRASTGLQGWRLAVATTEDGFVLSGASDDAMQGFAQGLVTSIRGDGSVAWSVRRMEGAWGQPARDPATGHLFVAFRPGLGSQTLDAMAGALSAGIDGYGADNGAPPPTGELSSMLVPTYMRAMPLNPLTSADARWSPTPSPGDYDYESTPTSFRVSIWDGEGNRVSVWEDGSRVGPWAVDEGFVESLARDGTRRWRVSLGDRVQPSPLMIADDGSVVVLPGDGILRALDPADGSERWRYALPGPGMSVTPPALLPDGGIVFGSGGGLIVIDPPGTLRWEWSNPIGGSAPPTVTSDGVILVGDSDGVLHAVRADRSVAWSFRIPGVAGASITTPALVHEGFTYLGLMDGTLVALRERSDFGLVPDPGGVLRAWKGADGTSVRLEWTSVPLPDVLGAHYHLRRMAGDPRVAGELLTRHAEQRTELLDAASPGPLAFYVLTSADCGENESPR